MPQTKTQGAVFGLLMSYFMALGMEGANVAHKLGAMSNAEIGRASCRERV